MTLQLGVQRCCSLYETDPLNTTEGLARTWLLVAGVRGDELVVRTVVLQARLLRCPPGAKQYLAVSEISYKNGLRLPVAELSALARAYGAYTIIDSAHGWGQIAIDTHAYGADFIAGAGHKWLGGGPGTGIFYVRCRAHPSLALS